MDLAAFVLIHMACFAAATLFGKWWLLLFPVLFWPLVLTQLDIEPYPIVASLYAAIGVGAVLAGLVVRWLVLRAKGADRRSIGS